MRHQYQIEPAYVGIQGDTLADRHAVHLASRKRIRSGFGLLDLMLALFIGAMALVAFFQLEEDTQQGLQATGMAQNLEVVAQAGQSYMKVNGSTLMNDLSTGSSVEVPLTGDSGPYSGMGSLASTGYFPSGFTTSVPRGQSIAFIVYHAAASGAVPEHLEGLVTTYGGSDFTDRQLGLIVNKIGGSGGAILRSPPPGIDSDTIQGAYGGWSYPASQWATQNVTPQAGHAMLSLSAIASPVSEFLDRYDTGNPEANTMHTDINLNDYSLANTYSVYGRDNSDLLLGNSSHTGRVVMENGGMACNGDATDCHFDISDDGGFYDHNDGWITFKGNYSNTGIKLKGDGDNLDVEGITVTEGGVITSDAKGVIFASSPSDQSSCTSSCTDVQNTTDASLTYDGTWLNATGSSAFAGIRAAIMSASEFVDENDSNYYVKPSGSSYLSFLNAEKAYISGTLEVVGLITADTDIRVEGKIGQGDYGPGDGLPNGWAGGFSGWDGMFHGSIGVGNNLDSNGHAQTYIDGTEGDVYINHGHAYVSQYLQSDSMLVAGADADNSGYSVTGARVEANGNITSYNGVLNMRGENDGSGSMTGGTGYFKNGVTIGRDAEGNLGNVTDSTGTGGGNLVVRGNQVISGSIKFDYGLASSDAGDNTDTGGLATPGGYCGPGQSTGAGSLAVSNKSGQQGLYFCGNDNYWHRIQLTDGYTD